MTCYIACDLTRGTLPTISPDADGTWLLVVAAPTAWLPVVGWRVRLRGDQLAELTRLARREGP